MFSLDCDRAYLYAHPERELTSGEIRRYESALAQRSSGIPAQYITGHQEFWGMDLIVSPSVLIPRPETEHVLEAVLELIASERASQKQRQNQSQSQKQSQKQSQNLSQKQRARAPALHDLRIVDVGTGSGAIALALAKELPAAEIHATDISSEALEIARANAARHALTSRINFRHADLLAGFPPATFDFVVSNPPYVGDTEEDSVQLEVRKFEPRNAVFSGPTGLEVIERLIPQAHLVVKPGGWLVFEISGTIASRIPHLLLDWQDSSIKNDLQGIPRVVIARKA